MAKLPRSEVLLRSRVARGERLNLHVGLVATTPHDGCRTHFGLSQKARLVLLLRSCPMPSFTERMRLAFCSATWTKPFSKSAASSKPYIPNVSLRKADGGYRREVGMTRFPSVTVLCLYYQIYFYNYSCIYCYSYSCISIFLYYHIVLCQYYR